jgi:hypothetical protein
MAAGGDDRNSSLAGRPPCRVTTGKTARSGGGRVDSKGAMHPIKNPARKRRSIVGGRGLSIYLSVPLVVNLDRYDILRKGMRYDSAWLSVLVIKTLQQLGGHFADSRYASKQQR